MSFYLSHACGKPDMEHTPQAQLGLVHKVAHRHPTTIGTPKIAIIYEAGSKIVIENVRNGLFSPAFPNLDKLMGIGVTRRNVPMAILDFFIHIAAQWFWFGATFGSTP